MNDHYSNLSADEKRLHKMYDIAEYCASFDGCSETKLIKFAKRWGNITPTIMRLFSDMGPNGLCLITRIGVLYYVTDTNYIKWGETKGFREKIYYSQCDECNGLYNSKLKECPRCGKTNKILNELGGGTHTQPIPQPDLQETPGLTTETNTHTHTKTPEHKPTPRQERVKEGRKADNRVVKILNQFGSAKIEAGRGGKPDVFFESERGRYCVEVKSVENMVRTDDEKVNGYKVGVVSLSRKQWVSLCAFSDINGLIPLMIVEVKIRGAQNLYHFIQRKEVDVKLEGTESNYIRISVYDLSIMSVHNYRDGLSLVGGFRL